MKLFTCFTLMILSFAFSAHATEEAELKLRVDGYVQTMMDGEKAAILKVKDYYSTVYLASKGTVEAVRKRSDGKFEAVLRFETTGKLQQDAEVSPPTRKTIKKKETVKRTVVFRVDPTILKWLTPLESPFVKPGSEKRYLLESSGE